MKVWFWYNAKKVFMMTDSSNSQIQRHVFSVIVDDEAGVLARVVGLFSGRGYNIDSLTVANVDKEKGISRITIVSSAIP